MALVVQQNLNEFIKYIGNLFSDPLIVFIQIITGYIPQGFIFVLFVLTFTQYLYIKKGQPHCKFISSVFPDIVRWPVFNLKNYILSSLLMSLFIVITRNMPIDVGVHTILNILILIGLSVLYNKLPLNSTIVGSLLVTILVYALEGINVLAVRLICGEQAFADKYRTALYILPSTIIFIVIVVLFYFAVEREKRLKDGADSK